MMKKKSKRIFTKSCKAGITKEMWVILTEMKLKLKKPKAQIIREALTEYYENHLSNA